MVSSSLSSIFMPYWLSKRSLPIKSPNPWMTPDILASKRHHRYLERVWRRNPTTLNRSRLTRQTHLCNRQVSKAKSAHYSKIIAEHSGDDWSLWKVFNKILRLCSRMHFLDHSSIEALTNTFSSFFVNKISIGHSSCPSDWCSHVLNPDTRKVFAERNLWHDDEARHLLLLAPYKLLDLDPIPTSVVTDCIDSIVTPMTSIINFGLWRVLPITLQVCPCLPSIEKPTLNKDNIKKYWPMSNLSSFSKVLEKVLANHLNTSNNAIIISLHVERFTWVKLPFFKSITIFRHQQMLTK